MCIHAIPAYGLEPIVPKTTIRKAMISDTPQRPRLLSKALAYAATPIFLRRRGSTTPASRSLRYTTRPAAVASIVQSEDAYGSAAQIARAAIAEPAPPKPDENLL